MTANNNIRTFFTLLLLTVAITLNAADIYQTTADLNLRSGPGSKYNSIGIVKNGENVSVLEKDNSLWFKVEYNGKNGFLSSKFLTLVVVEPPKVAISIDSVNAHIYISETDYTTFGKVFIYDFFGALVDSFAVNVSPGTFAFDVRNTTGISENNVSTNLFTYPNPVSDELHIGFIDSENEKATLTLTDVLGQEVYKKQINTNVSNTLSLNTLPQGVYFLKVETTSGSATKKIVKE